MAGRKRDRGHASRPRRNGGNPGTHFISTPPSGSLTQEQREANDKEWLESYAEQYMRIRVTTYAKMGFIPRRDTYLDATIRQWWGERFIKEYNMAPFVKQRNTVCRG